MKFQSLNSLTKSNRSVVLQHTQTKTIEKEIVQTSLHETQHTLGNEKIHYKSALKVEVNQIVSRIQEFVLDHNNIR